MRVQFNFLMCLLLLFPSCLPLHLLSSRAITPAQLLIHQKSPYSHKCYPALWSLSALCIFLSHSSLIYIHTSLFFVHLPMHSHSSLSNKSHSPMQPDTNTAYMTIYNNRNIQLSVTYFTSLHRRKT